jgi:hypothetical protein
MNKENRVVTVDNTKSLSGLGNLGTVGGNAGTNQQGSGTTTTTSTTTTTTSDKK